MNSVLTILILLVHPEIPFCKAQLRLQVNHFHFQILGFFFN